MDKKNVYLEMRKLKETELLRLKNIGKKQRIRRKKDRARRGAYKLLAYFTMSKCNQLFITYFTRSTERLPSLPSSFSTISTISMTVVMITLFN